MLFFSLKRAKYTVFQHARSFRCICSQVQTPSVVKIALLSLHFKMFSPRRVTRAFERLLFLTGRHRGCRRPTTKGRDAAGTRQLQEKDRNPSYRKE